MNRIRALYVTGGGFHEFVKQEAIVPPAVARQVNVTWTIDHTAGTSTDLLWAAGRLQDDGTPAPGYAAR